MTDDVVIRVNELSKHFNANQINQALSNISFELKRGDVLGLIGDNGAGKSTLLRIISGLTKPDAGEVCFEGKLSYILDIGSCFHPDLSGMDNIYLVGRINGFSKKQINERIDSIIEFSELQNFINTPLKYYSTGMYLRLAFTVNTSFYSSILLLDEIMSVGDLHFQQKASQRITEIVNDGTTVIMTGHDLESLSTLCTKGLWLRSGQQAYLGDINEAVDKYLSYANKETERSNKVLKPAKLLLGSVQTGSMGTKDINPIETTQRANTEPVYIQYTNQIYQDQNDTITLIEAGIKSTGKSFDDEIYMDDELEILIRYHKKVSKPCVLFAVIQDKFGHNLMSISSHRLSDESKFVNIDAAGTYSQTIRIPRGLFNHGVFSISLFFTDGEEEDLAVFKRQLFFKVNTSGYRFGAFNYKGNFPGTLMPFFDWTSVKES